MSISDHKKKIGIMDILLGAVLLFLAVCWWYKSRGIQLLYANSKWGKFYPYYWMPGILGAAFVAAGIVLLERAKENRKVSMLENTADAIGEERT